MRLTMLHQQPLRRAVETFRTSSLPRHRIARSQRRCLHQLPTLTKSGEFKKNGIGKMLSVDGYTEAWEEQQSYLLGRLNQMVDQGPEANATSKDLLLKYARSGSHAALFNYASMAHNNHFFFSGLLDPSSSPPSTKAGVPSSLTPYMLEEIVKAFGSLTTFRKSIIAHANAMFGPGFTWLVARREPLSMTRNNSAGSSSRPSLSIMNTYLAGTPYPQGHFRQQSVDMNTGRPGVLGGTNPALYAQEQSEAGARAYGLHAQGRDDRTGLHPLTAAAGRKAGMNMSASTIGDTKGQLAPGAQDLEPLLCVSTWEHVWLYDHGVGGKQRYLEAWFDCVDWKTAEGKWSAKGNIKSNYDDKKMRSQYDYQGGYNSEARV